MPHHLWTPATPTPAAERAAVLATAYLARPGADTPVLLLDRDGLRSQLTRWHRHLPAVPPYYAVKANIDPLVLRELFAAGANADVASAFEIDVCRAVGLGGERMILSNPRKDRDTIRAMKAAGVWATAVDSEEEVDKLTAEGIPSAGYQPVLFVRVKVPTKGVTQDLSSKFGVRVLPKGTDPFARPLPSPDMTAVRAILEHARAAGFRRFGLSTHVGTQCNNPAVYATAVQVCGAVATALGGSGVEVGWIDLGGGFADGRTLAANGTTADALLDGVAAAVAGWSGPPVKFLAEPGRHLVADSGLLVSRVTYDRDTDATGRRVQIDDGIYRTLSGRVHDDRTYQFAALRVCGRPFMTAHCRMVVWGCSCDSFDKVADDVPLPADLSVGDLLLADTLGAYSTSFGSNTNGFQPAPPVLWWDDAGATRFEPSPMGEQNAVLLAYLRRRLAPSANQETA